MKKLSTAEAFYVESHYGKKDAKDIATDLGLSVHTVRAYLRKLEEAGVKPAQPATASAPEPDKGGAKKAGLAVGKGTVSMTKSASEKADERYGNAPFADPDRRKAIEAERSQRNEKFFQQRVKNSIHVIDPSRPVT